MHALVQVFQFLFEVFSIGLPRHAIDPGRSVTREREIAPLQEVEAAKPTLFGALAASGWHTAAVTMRLLVKNGLPIAGGIIGSGGELGWLKPARPGDTLSVESEIVEITPSRSRPDRGSVRVRSETRNQHGDVIQTFTARLVVPRRV